MGESPSSFSGPLLTGAADDPDPEWAEYVAWLDREVATGHGAGPEARVIEEPGPEPWDSWSDDPEDPEPADPEFAGPQAPPAHQRYQPLFSQGGQADLLPPGPGLTGLTDLAVADLNRLSDSELVGVLRAARRQVAREQYKQVLVTAEFGRRRQAAFADAAARGIPVGCRPGGFPGEELAIELVSTRAEAGHRIDDAIDLTTRLPRTLARMAAGDIEEERAGWIALYTRSLTLADAAMADEVLAEAAPDLRVEQVARKAAALEMRLNPAAVKARREHAKQNEQRVEARREASGNASLAGRELDTADVMASKAYIDAIVVKLRDSGLVDGSLARLRALALTDLTQGRDPLQRIQSVPPVPPASATSAPDRRGSLGDDRARFPGRSGEPGPLPALINLIVPVGALLGWSDAPSQDGAWGLLDSQETRTVIGAAARHPRTRWCVTLTGADGTALAHGCARGSRRRLLSDLAPQPPTQEQLAELLRRLGLALTPIARGACDHARSEDHYAPSRALRHLVRARTATCDAPGCPAQAMTTDLDHTVPWPDGSTDQCNLAPRCRTHHRAKQAPDWTIEQLAPGVTRWTLPSGRTYTTTPTIYDA